MEFAHTGYMQRTELGQRIRARRLAKRWSQTKLAELLGVTQPTISDLERGVAANWEFIGRVCKALGTTISEMTSEHWQPATPAERAG
jgi:transcriptional regulator with XRE-family HTH domain